MARQLQSSSQRVSAEWSLENLTRWLQENRQRLFEAMIEQAQIHLKNTDYTEDQKFALLREFSRDINKDKYLTMLRPGYFEAPMVPISQGDWEEGFGLNMLQWDAETEEVHDQGWDAAYTYQELVDLILDKGAFEIDFGAQGQI